MVELGGGLHLSRIECFVSIKVLNPISYVFLETEPIAFVVCGDNFILNSDKLYGT